MFTEHPLLPFYPPEGNLEGTLETGLELNSSALPPTEGPPGPRNQPNTALLSLILMLGTFLIAFFLRKFRNSRFLGGKVLCASWFLLSLLSSPPETSSPFPDQSIGPTTSSPNKTRMPPICGWHTGGSPRGTF